MVFTVEIVQNILNIAKTRKVNNQQLCKILETNSNKIYDWKIGKSKPSAEDISKLADYFNVSADYLLGRDVPIKTKTDDSTEALSYAASLSSSQKQLVELAESLTDDEIKKVLSYIRFVLSERDGK